MLPQVRHYKTHNSLHCKEMKKLFLIYFGCAQCTAYSICFSNRYSTPLAGYASTGCRGQIWWALPREQ